MKTILLLLILVYLPSVSRASSWNPVGSYGEKYDCDEEAQKNGFHSGSYYLHVAEVPGQAGKQKKYNIGIDMNTCPTGHLCDFFGTGEMVNDQLILTPRQPSKDDDETLWKECKLSVSKNKDGSLKIEEQKPIACESYFLCGANTGLSHPNLKKLESKKSKASK